MATASTPFPETIDITLGGETSNSYCDLDYANTYFANHFSSTKSSAWAALTDGQKTQVLIQACWLIEQARFTINTYYRMSSISPNFLWSNAAGRFAPYPNVSGEPEKYYYYQLLQFPRNRDIASDGSIYIPDRVCKAQCEQAIYLTTFDDTAISNTLQGISLDSVTVDKIKLTQEYTDGARGTSLAPITLDLLKPYIIWNQRIKRS